jgi:hypothetical protein
MKAFAIGAAVVMCLGVSACAGVATRSPAARGGPLGADVDYGKVIAVNEWAQRRGATLMWVHYPKLPPEGRPNGG